MHGTPHLVVSISGHGFGHVAQTAPILNLLNERMPKLRISIRSVVSLAHLRARVRAPFDHLPSNGDIGMMMSSALDINLEASREAYRNFHLNWEEKVRAEAQRLRDLGADFVFSNVGYLPLAGAQCMGIPNAALCSLNWFDIYRHYCGTNEVSEQIHHCYVNSTAFLRATPGMEMTSLTNLIPVAPIAEIGQNQRDAINRHLKLSTSQKLVLISMGGIASRLPIEQWPRINGVLWLVQENWGVNHPDAINIESLPVSFCDLIASCDTLLCKPGYGSFVEAASCGTPVLYISRSDWPESAALITWLQRYGLCREISREDARTGNIASLLHEIWNCPKPEPFIPTGANQVADWLIEKLGNSL